MEKLINKAMTQKVETLITAIRMLGGGNLSVDKTMARAAMFTALENKVGGDVVDRLFAELGM